VSVGLKLSKLKCTAICWISKHVRNQNQIGIRKKQIGELRKICKCKDTVQTADLPAEFENIAKVESGQLSSVD